MTQDETTKALELCISENLLCDVCPYSFVKDRIKQTAEDALALINLKDAKIAELEAEIDKQYEQAEADILGNISDGGTSCHWCIDKHRANAIREFVEKLGDGLAPTMTTLFVIGEILVDVSKSHLSSEEGVKKIRDVLGSNNVISSRFGLDKLLSKLVKEMTEDKT